jgi:hypothetical protein
MPASGDAHAARLTCDLDRAAEITLRNEAQQGPLPAATPSIVHILAPARPARVCTVYEQHGRNFAQARSVPLNEAAGWTPSGRLEPALPGDVTEAVQQLSREIETGAPAAYGARKEAARNRDGSHALRLVFDSHDIVTPLGPKGGGTFFSRHARSDDAASRLNQLIIDVASISSAWSCDGH